MNLHNLTLAAAVVASFFGGMAVGASHINREEAPIVAQEHAAASSPQTVYFPSQFVSGEELNQAAEEHIESF